MLYLLYGTDVDKSRAKVRELLDSLLRKKPDASFTRVDNESFDSENLDFLIGGQGLFEAKQIVILDTLCKNAEAKSAILKRRKELKDSSNVFFLLEEELDSATLAKLEKVSERVECFGKRKKESIQKNTFNTFALCDALGARDRRKLWVLYQKGKRANLSDEEMHGVLFWQSKNMSLAKGARSAKDAGLNPFVYGKASSFAENYTDEELQTLSRTLVSLTHDARRGKHTLSVALERFLLTI